MSDQLLVTQLNIILEHPLLFVLYATGALLLVIGIATSIIAPILGLSERVRSHAMNYTGLGAGLAFPVGFPMFFKFINPDFDIYSSPVAKMVLVGTPILIMILCVYSALSIEKNYRKGFMNKVSDNV